MCEGSRSRAHVAYLRKRFTIISLDELLDLWRTNRLKRDQSYCVITFDDGWKDNYQFAFPVLMKHRIPATIFLATDFIGTARWFWPDQMMLLLEKSRQHTTSAADRKAVSTVLGGDDWSHAVSGRRDLSTRRIGRSD